MANEPRELGKLDEEYTKAKGVTLSLPLTTRKAINRLRKGAEKASHVVCRAVDLLDTNPTPHSPDAGHDDLTKIGFQSVVFEPATRDWSKDLMQPDLWIITPDLLAFIKTHRRHAPALAKRANDPNTRTIITTDHFKGLPGGGLQLSDEVRIAFEHLGISKRESLNRNFRVHFEKHLPFQFFLFTNNKLVTQIHQGTEMTPHASQFAFEFKPAGPGSYFDGWKRIYLDSFRRHASWPESGDSMNYFLRWLNGEFGSPE